MSDVDQSGTATGPSSVTCPASTGAELAELAGAGMDRLDHGAPGRDLGVVDQLGHGEHG